jgi:DNA-binding Xre family transcriptional regulator
MIDFSPLHETLKEKNIKISVMRDFLSSTTVTKINRNEIDSDFKLSTIEDICLFLNVPIEKVVKITKNK